MLFMPDIHTPQSSGIKSMPDLRIIGIQNNCLKVRTAYPTCCGKHLI